MQTRFEYISSRYFQTRLIHGEIPTQKCIGFLITSINYYDLVYHFWGVEDSKSLQQVVM